MFDKLYEKLSKINDNRVKGRVKYPLVLILMILFIGVLKGGNGWKEIRMLAQVSILELKKFYPTLANDNFPAVDTIARAVKKVDPAEYSALLATYKLNLTQEEGDSITSDVDLGGISGLNESECVYVAVDGKEIRGATAGSAEDHVIIVNAVCEGQVISEEKVKDAQKKNEIKAFPSIFEKVTQYLGPLGRPIVWTTDAMCCQHSIENLIVGRGDKYLLSLKENHRIMFHEVESLFSEAYKYQNELNIRSFERGPEKGHGRIDNYSSVAIDVSKGLGREWISQIGDWQEIKTVVRITRTSYNLKDNKTSIHERYYITNLDPDPKLLLEIRLKHWTVETEHHYLDCSYSEDKCRVKNLNSAQILSSTRKLALRALKIVQTRINESIAFLIKKLCSSSSIFAEVIGILDDYFA